MTTYALILLTLALMLTGCAHQATAADPPQRRTTAVHNGNWNDVPYGMNGFHPNGPAPAGHLAHFTDANIQRLKDGDIRWVRIMLDWRYIEPEQDKFHWDDLDRVVNRLNKEKIGMSVCIYEPPKWALEDGSKWLTKPPYLEAFSYAIASRYRDRIASYELDNEMATGEWPRIAERRPSLYVPRLKACYVGIKRGDPNAIVVMTGIWQFPMYYLEDMYKAGAKNYFDAVNIHYYLGGDRDPKLMDPFLGDLDLVLKQVDYVTKKYGDGKKPLWFTEYGWPATAQSQSAPVGEEKMAEYMKYFLEHCRDSGIVDKCFWYVYYLSDGMALWHESENKKRPAWYTHVQFQKDFPSWAKLPVKPLPAPPPASMEAQIPDGDFETGAAWTPDPANVKFSFVNNENSEKNAPQSGKQFVHMVWQKPFSYLRGQSFPIEGGKAYELTGQIRMTGGMANSFYAHAMIELHLLGDDDKPLGIVGPLQGKPGALSTNYYINDTDNQWYEVHYNVFMPATAKAARIVLRLGHRDTTTGEADFDNIHLKPLDLTKYDR